MLFGTCVHSPPAGRFCVDWLVKEGFLARFVEIWTAGIGWLVVHLCVKMCRFFGQSVGRKDGTKRKRRGGRRMYVCG